MPSVTEILAWASTALLRHVDAYKLEVASARGTRVHDACATYDEGFLDINRLDPALVPYVSAWMQFREDTGFVPDLIEQPIVHEGLGFGTTPDRRGAFRDGRRRLVELKTNVSIPRWVGLQLSGQEVALNDGPHKRLAVRLKEDGRYSLHEFRDPSDKTVFLSALNIANWRMENEYSTLEKGIGEV